MSWYVSRDGSGNINGLCANAQPNAQELLADDNAEVVAYLAAVAPGGSKQVTDSRAGADAILASDHSAPAKVMRAIALTLIDEINLLRQRLRAQDAAVAAAASLADLKTRWAALSPVPDRTAQQAITAITAKIDGGSAD